MKYMNKIHKIYNMDEGKTWKNNQTIYNIKKHIDYQINEVYEVHFIVFIQCISCILIIAIHLKYTPRYPI